MVKRIYLLIILTALFLIPAVSIASKETTEDKVKTKIARISIPFIENTGQIENDKVSFYAKTLGGTVFITTNGEIVYSLSETPLPVIARGEAPKQSPSKGIALKEILLGGKIKEVKGEGESITKVSYFRGNDPLKWKRNIPTHNFVSLGEVYNGIELKLKAHGNNVEKLFLVKPDANPDEIRLKLEGAKGIKVNGKGELEVETELGVVKFSKPAAYQEINGKRVEVVVSYLIPRFEINNPQFAYSFKVEDYDRTKELVIDPLLASTFLGGSSDDHAQSIAIDPFGNVYVAGYTYSSNFPTEGYDVSFNYGNTDVFVSKFNSNLTELLASTFIGGSYDDGAYAIVLDSSGNVYVTGYTWSSNYPKTSGAYNESFNDGGMGGGDVFISKFNNTLTDLFASTFIGGTKGERSHAIALDSSGNVYVAGTTYSDNYPFTPNAYDTVLSFNTNDVFVSKLDGNLTTLLASTFLGEGGNDFTGNWCHDFAYSIGIDNSGNVYIAGVTTGQYPLQCIPTTIGAYDTTNDYGSNAFISKFDSNLTTLIASTFLGKNDNDTAYGIALDSSGNVYVTGETSSPDFPTTPGSYNTSFYGGYEVFIARLNSDLTTLLSSTFLGGSMYDSASSIAIDTSGNVYVTGRTLSVDYPTTPGPIMKVILVIMMSLSQDLIASLQLL